jgi:DNA-binding NarL/FixJ family response regulator
VCDDHAVVRTGLRLVLDREPDVQVIAEADTADEAVAVASALNPDVFVVDLVLQGDSGVVATRKILEVSPGTRVLILTMHDDVTYLRDAFAAGAAGFLNKRAADVELLTAVRTVAAGERYLHQTLDPDPLKPPATGGAPPASPITPRETDILREIGLGFTNQQIAERLVLSVRTVETYRANIQQKLGLRKRSELVRYARDTGLL